MVTKFFSKLFRPPVFILLVLMVVSIIELAIANRKYGLFSGGFGQSSTVDTASEITIFLCGFALAQIAVAILGWRLSCWLAGNRNGNPKALVHFAFLYGGLSLIALNLQYQLHSYFSDAVSFALLKQLGGGSATDALLFAKNEIALGLAAVILFGLIWWGGMRLVSRYAPPQQDWSMPRWRWIGLAWLGFAVAVLAIPRIDSDSSKGLGRILAWSGMTSALAEASDFDRDGYGLAGRNIDSHPFDASRHPLALDIPGNGIDEDGYGGDLALVDIPKALPEIPIIGNRPHVVIVVFESTRADVLGKRIDGRPVAPNLEQVVREGAAIAPAFSHVGFTTASLKSIFGGALVVGEGAPSLFRELKQSGYRIGVFSGQPEDFGGISEAVGMRENATFFVDADMLKDQRAFSFAAQGSLLIDEKIILDEFEKVLGEQEDWAEPQFVYLNFQSPHFPYHHSGIASRFADPPLKRNQISAANRERVAQTYWNAVAHTDAALGQLIDHLKEVGAWENTVLLVTGDHGEALFEKGFLGHGHIINQLQYGTFLASNRAIGAVEAPIAISDYRHILLKMVGADVPDLPRFAPFMHIGPLDHPTAIGIVDPRFGVISLRFDKGEACFERKMGCIAYTALENEALQAVDALVARWGSERWAYRKLVSTPQ